MKVNGKNMKIAGSSNNKLGLRKLLCAYWCCSSDYFGSIFLNDDGTITKGVKDIKNIVWWAKGDRFYFGYEEK